jgi:hypothetical protein
LATIVVGWALARANPPTHTPLERVSRNTNGLKNEEENEVCTGNTCPPPTQQTHVQHDGNHRAWPHLITKGCAEPRAASVSSLSLPQGFLDSRVRVMQCESQNSNRFFVPTFHHMSLLNERKCQNSGFTGARLALQNTCSTCVHAILHCATTCHTIRLKGLEHTVVPLTLQKNSGGRAVHCHQECVLGGCMGGCEKPHPTPQKNTKKTLPLM